MPCAPDRRCHTVIAGVVCRPALRPRTGPTCPPHRGCNGFGFVLWPGAPTPRREPHHAARPPPLRRDAGDAGGGGGCGPPRPLLSPVSPLPLEGQRRLGVCSGLAGGGIALALKRWAVVALSVSASAAFCSFPSGEWLLAPIISCLAPIEIIWPAFVLLGWHLQDFFLAWLGIRLWFFLHVLCHLGGGVRQLSPPCLEARCCLGASPLVLWRRRTRSPAAFPGGGPPVSHCGARRPPERSVRPVRAAFPGAAVCALWQVGVRVSVEWT